MTHDELKTRIQDKFNNQTPLHDAQIVNALYRVVELHEPKYGDFPDEEVSCEWCFYLAYEPTGLSMDYEDYAYPCATIRAIEKELL